MRTRDAVAALALAMGMTAAAAQEPVRLFAAGSLRAAMTDIAQAYTAGGSARVELTFGASGLLRERIERGERADVFASASLEHPQALAAAGRARPVVVFARNQLCALAAPGVALTSATVLERMLDTAVRVATSTPKADPAGDYAWLVFGKADKLRPGAYAVLDAKALKLVGGRDAPAPPPGRSIYGLLLAEGKADVFLTYCTNAIEAAAQVPGARSVALPEALAVGADYGLTTIAGAGPEAAAFALFVLSIRGQELLARHGFTPVALP